MTTPELAELIVVCAFAYVGLGSVKYADERMGRWAGRLLAWCIVLAVLVTEIRLIVAPVLRFVAWVRS